VKRFRRWLFNGLASISLLLCVGTMALWVRSYRTASEFGYFGKVAPDSLEHDYFFISKTGCILYVWLHQPAHGIRPQLAIQESPVSGASLPSARVLGFGFRKMSTSAPSPSLDWRELIVPYWFISLTLAAIAIMGFRNEVSHRREMRPGLCTFCGYDLRATPDRCPECGKSVEKAI